VITPSFLAATTRTARVPLTTSDFADDLYALLFDRYGAGDGRPNPERCVRLCSQSLAIGKGPSHTDKYHELDVSWVVSTEPFCGIHRCSERSSKGGSTEVIHCKGIVGSHQLQGYHELIPVRRIVIDE